MELGRYCSLCTSMSCNLPDEDSKRKSITWQTIGLADIAHRVLGCDLQKTREFRKRLDAAGNVCQTLPGDGCAVTIAARAGGLLRSPGWRWAWQEGRYGTKT
jgi:hypothetical protein